MWKIYENVLYIYIYIIRFKKEREKEERKWGRRKGSGEAGERDPREHDR